MESSERVLSQVRILSALPVESLDQHRDYVRLIEQVGTTLILVCEAIEESNQVLLHLDRLRVEEDFEDALPLITLLSILDLEKVVVHEGGEYLAPHRRTHSCQSPSQGLQCGTDVSLIGLRVVQESLQLGEVEWDETDPELATLASTLILLTLWATAVNLMVIHWKLILLLNLTVVVTLAIVLDSLVLEMRGATTARERSICPV